MSLMLKEIDKQTHIEFLKDYQTFSFLQLPCWAEVKSGWKSKSVGWFDDRKLVCVGLILYSLGSKMIPAAELTLLSLTEVIGGIFWVWLPILGINEVPTNNTIIGGFLIFISIIYYSLIIKNNRRFIALN